MVQNNWSKVFLVMLFTFALFGINYAYGMFDGLGEWVCSGEIDIEKSYYESYTDTFQKIIDKVYLSDGAKAAKSYFEFAVESEPNGQDWKRSQVCLVRLGVDTAELSQIAIPADKTPDPLSPEISSSIDEAEDSTMKDELLPIEELSRIEKYEPGTTDESYYFGAAAIAVVIIAVLALFFVKSRTKYQNSK